LRHRHREDIQALSGEEVQAESTKKFFFFEGLE